MEPAYSVVLVQRIMAESAAPSFVPLAPFNGVTGLTWSRRANRPSTIQFSVAADVQEAEVDAVLTDLANSPIEVWVYRDAELVFAGPLWMTQVQGPTLTVQCNDISGYMNRWIILPGDPQVFTGVDQFVIAKTLIDYWQAQDWGNFGIVTSGMGTSGVLRDRTYPDTEPHIIGQRISELSNTVDGFEWYINPATRAFLCASPSFGGVPIIVDAASIEEASGVWSIGPEDFATLAVAYSSDRETNTTLTALAEDTARSQMMGRLAHTASYQDISVQATLDDKVAQQLADRSDEFFVPSALLGLERVIDYTDLAIGTTVEFAYDFGFSPYETTRRLIGWVVQVHDVTGRERVTLELA